MSSREFFLGLRSASCPNHSGFGSLGLPMSCLYLPKAGYASWGALQASVGASAAFFSVSWSPTKFSQGDGHFQTAPRVGNSACVTIPPELGFLFGLPLQATPRKGTKQHSETMFAT